MRWVLGIAAALVAAAVSAVAVAGVLRRSTTDAAQAQTASFRSVALDSRLHYLVRLPPGYATSGKRYPVVYFLHGLPAGPTSYQAVAWVENALDVAGGQAILVAPQGTRRVDGDPEYHDWGPGRNWATALAVELPRAIDRAYRTIPTRAGRAIVGVSAGGYGAVILGLQHPQQFSVIESWSGYFEPTDPTGQNVLDLGSQQANDAASAHARSRSLSAQFRRYPTFLAFYVGRSDPTFLEDNVTFNAELNASGVPHAFTTYPGAHTVALWSAHAPDWLRMALNHLSRPR
jgi:S-formylglutathione hydrolase FrmB